MRILTIVAAFAACFTLLPAAVLLTGRGASAESAPRQPDSSEASGTEPIQPTASLEDYRVLDITTGSVEAVSVRDYVIGAVCAEMPATFEPEALKAQAVAAHTYAERQRRSEAQSPTAELSGADFSNDSRHYQAFYTLDQIKGFYGDSFDVYYPKVEAAVDAVLEEILCYQDAPIIAAFHSLSTGVTEDAAQVWGSAVPYLVPVDSPADCEAPKYREEVTLTADVVKEKLLTAVPELKLSDQPGDWFGEAKRTDSGTVCTMQVGDQSLGGQTLRGAFGLRSAAFTLSLEGDSFTFVTKGYGHCVGMSQYGANAMAAEGSSYADILAHYYPGTELKDCRA